MRLLRSINRINRKGQSAIEYLTTYGWAILAIVIAGAVILVLLNQNSATCQKTAPATVLTGQLQLQNWQFVGNDKVEVQFRNSGAESVTLNNVWVDTDQNGVFGEGTASPASSLNSGATTSVTVSNITGISSGCNDFDFVTSYTVSGLTNAANVTGTLRGPL